jgi:hypothetical protein
MAFEPQIQITAEDIGRIIVTLSDATVGGGDEGLDPVQSANFDIVVNMSSGHRRQRGNLVPHLERGWIMVQQAFLDMVRTKARAEILGESVAPESVVDVLTAILAELTG